MRGPISRWVLARVIRASFAFETEAIELYRHLRERVGGARACDGALHDALCRLLDEEERHWKILAEASKGTLSLEELEKHLGGRASSELATLPALSGEDLRTWGGELTRALEQEEKTWIFYGNLRRMSKVPVVRKAFEVLAEMEKGHVAVLRRLLGRDSSDGG
jgi:rubrerythrin